MRQQTYTRGKKTLAIRKIPKMIEIGQIEV
jgi:hypothetical protein